MQSGVCESVDESATGSTSKKLLSSPASASSSVELLRSASHSPPVTVAADHIIPPSVQEMKPAALPSKSASTAASSSTDFSIMSILSRRQAPTAKSSQSPPVAERSSPSPLSGEVVSTSGRCQDDDDAVVFDVGSPQRRVDTDSDRTSAGGGTSSESGLSAALRQLLERQLVGPTAAAAVAAAAASGSAWYPTWLQSAFLHRRFGTQTSASDGLSSLFINRYLDIYLYLQSIVRSTFVSV